MSIDVDGALQKLGKWGKWQIMFYIIVSIADTFPSAWHMLAIVFIGGKPEHHCKLPVGVSPNNITLPLNAEGDGLSGCLMYKNTSDGYINKTMSCTDGWEYSGQVGYTIISQWDLVCKYDWMKDTSQTVMVVGVMVGAMLFTALSDNIGRKPVFIFSHLGMVVIGVITAFCGNFYFFMVLRFFAGMLQQGIILTGFVMACELFPAEMRTAAGMAIENFWASAMCILALLAYLIRDWRYLQLAISLPGILCLSFIWILPESIPWLCANERVKEAEDILQNAAKFNNTYMPPNVLGVPEEKENMINNVDDVKTNGKVPQKKSFLEKIHFKKASTEKKDESVIKYTLIDVFRHGLLRKYAIIMCLLWFVNSLVYYGLSLSTSELAGDPYLNFFLSGLVEIPAYTACIFLLQKWGRRWPLAVFHIMAGVALGITMFINVEKYPNLLPLTITLNMIGKFGITGSFGIVFLYAPEIFPTTLRSQAMGISSLGGRLGNVLAPYSSYMAAKVPWLPGILFGLLSIGVGILTFLLPETLNRPLPQTLEDIENWTKTPPPDANESKMEPLTNCNEKELDSKC